MGALLLSSYRRPGCAHDISCAPGARMPAICIIDQIAVQPLQLGSQSAQRLIRCCLSRLEQTPYGVLTNPPPHVAQVC